MAVFSIYRYASLSWRRQWRGSSYFNEILAGFFDSILTTMRIPLLRRRFTSMFNTYRDRVHDHLNTIDPTNFPRFGQSNISAADIFVHMCRFEGDHRLARLGFACDDGAHQPAPLIKTHSVTFVLLEHRISLAEHGFTGKPTLQLWLSSYLHKVEDTSPQCQTCYMPCSCSSLSLAPLPWIWIHIPPEYDQLFVPSTALTFRQHPGPDVYYTLVGVIYVGGITSRPVGGACLESGGCMMEWRTRVDPCWIRSRTMSNSLNSDSG